jgi:hypothetical protein
MGGFFMGFKEKIMENMIGKMSAQEKKDIMDKMMDGFFSTMSNEEKREMMKSMMPKMMEQMMGNGNKGMDGGMMGMMSSMTGGGGSMMDMMHSMMGGRGCMSDKMGQKEGKEDNSGSTGFNPMDMCRKMMSAISRSSEIATFATPEVRQMFDEWVQQVDEEILAYVKETGSTDPDQIGAYLKISKNSVIYFLSRLAQKGKLSIKIEKTENKEDL